MRVTQLHTFREAYPGLGMILGVFPIQKQVNVYNQLTKDHDPRW